MPDSNPYSNTPTSQDSTTGSTHRRHSLLPSCTVAILASLVFSLDNDSHESNLFSSFYTRYGWSVEAVLAVLFAVTISAFLESISRRVLKLMISRRSSIDRLHRTHKSTILNYGVPFIAFPTGLFSAWISHFSVSILLCIYNRLF